MKLREAATGLLTTVITVSVVLAISEIAIRIYTRHRLIYDVEMSRYAMELKAGSPNALIGHVHRPNTEALLMGVPVRINSDGLRDREYPVRRNASRRIIFLGDSLTFGWGVPKSKTFEEIIESRANRDQPTEIINFGIGNYNTVQEVNLFLEKGLKYKPDEVAIFYFINDAEPVPQKSRWEILGHLRIVTFFWSRVQSVLARFGAKQDYREYYSGLYADTQPGWIAARKAFLELRDVCNRRRIVLRVIVLPELHELRKYPFAREHQELLSFLQDSGIAARDLAPWFAWEKEPSSLWVAPDDAHPNEIAHGLIASHSFDFVMDGIRGNHGRAN